VVPRKFLNINWVGPEEPSPETITRTHEELQELIASGSKASSIVSHVVMLTRDFDGPGVMVHGNEDGSFDAEYASNIKWVSIMELLDAED
jgi:hypothetical protein